MSVGTRRGRLYGSFALASLTLASAGAEPAGAQQVTAISGTFHSVWVDPRAAAPPEPLYFVSGPAGTVRLDVTAQQLAAWGGRQALERRSVTVSGTLLPAGAPGPGVALVRTEVPVLRVSEIRADGAVLGAPVSGSRAYVTILCRFPDVAPLPGAITRYQAIAGTTSPGLDHYWREVSENQIDLGGSVVTDWYTLPQPFSYYSTNDVLDLDRLAQDCTGAADDDVNFQHFVGINMQFNANFAASWGGSWSFNRDGLNTVMPMTWMADWAGQSVYAHEMGHSFGFPHSSGPYAQVYDSPWDVMSSAYVRFVGGTHQWIAQQTITYHKGLAGWIGGRTTTLNTNVLAVTLERSAQPTAGGLLEVRIPVAGQDAFFTVEARKQVGYDVGLPSEGVIIHLVSPALAQPARVRDGDANGTTNDGGSVWTPGETFWDPALRTAVRVESATPTGWQVYARRNAVVVTAAAAGPGGVVASPGGITCPGDCSEPYGGGETVTLTATPGEAAVFQGWSGACTGTGPCVVSPTSDVSVTATFVARAEMTVTVEGPGSVTSAPAGIDCPDECAASFDAGVELTLTAAAETGAAFAGWSGACTGTDAVCRLEPAGAASVVASFGVPRYALDVAVTGPGTVVSEPAGIACPGDCSEELDQGAEVTLIATPDGGAAFDGWGGACTGTGACVVSLSETRSVTAAFSAPLEITSAAARPDGVMGATYADQLDASGGTAVYVWSLEAGVLPEGVALSAAGVLSGVPAAAGEFAFTVKAASGGIEATKELTLTVAAPVLQAEGVVDAILATSPLSADEARYLDLQGNRNGRVDAGDVRAWLQRQGVVATEEP